MGYLVEKIGYIMGISLGYDGISLDITIWQIVSLFWGAGGSDSFTGCNIEASSSTSWDMGPLQLC